MGDRRDLPLEEVARSPLPGTAVPAAIAFSPDDRLITWLHSPDRTLRRRLFACDPDTGATRDAFTVLGEEIDEGSLSIEEQLRRERARELATGITGYAWAKEAVRLLVPLPDGLWTRDGVDGDQRLVVPAVADGPLLDPQLSPDGTWVAYVHRDELHVVAADGSSSPRALTEGASESGRTHGLAEFVAQEEMDRSHGYWWSPDSRRIAFCEVDETHIPVYRIVHQGSDRAAEAHEDHRYPFAGGSNARVRLAVVEVSGSDPVWIDLERFGGDEFYLARVDWSCDGRLFVQLMDRPQATLRLVAFDPASGEGRVLLTETSDVWINLHSLLRPLADGRFLWASERTGFRHLELRSADGSLDRVLTSGEWMVEAVAAVDSAHVWFTATRESPLERHLYAVDLDGGEPRRLTPERGTHAVVVDHGRRRFVDVFSSASSPPVVLLRDLDDGRIVRRLFDEPDPRVESLDLEPPELVTVAADDGVTLHVAVYRPAGDPPFPTIVSVYGGPGVQRVVDAWAVTVSMRAQYLRRLGYLVVAADNRGSAWRGVAFEAPIRRDLGRVEVADQVAVVRSLAGAGLVDPGRVGIYGWSYGGYMSALCLARAPEVFRAAVAGAPVTHWDGYDTCYTERYMGLPVDNPDGYERSSVMAHVAGMRDRDLLLVHGLIDENVHFRHTARLVNALVRARVPHGLLLFPDERHLPRREEDRVFMEEQVRDFFLAKLPL